MPADLNDVNYIPPTASELDCNEATVAAPWKSLSTHNCQPALAGKSLDAIYTDLEDLTTSEFFISPTAIASQLMTHVNIVDARLPESGFKIRATEMLKVTRREAPNINNNGH